MHVSVIVPTLNEERIIDETLSYLTVLDSLDVIVVDGDSTDRTVELAKKHPVRLITSPRGRSRQMNAGARVAKGEVLLFLHADCRLPAGWLAAVGDAWREGFAGGCFTQHIDSDRRIYRLIESMGNLRARRCGVYFGDQAIFADREVFRSLGGYDDVDIFEDVLFSKKLSRYGKTGVLTAKLLVSPRRWEEKGIVRTTLLFWFLTIGFLLRFPLWWLKKFYADVR